MRFVAMTLAFAVLSVGFAPAPFPKAARQAGLPSGKWRVEYVNGVTEVCEFQDDGTPTVVEPVRIAGRKASVSGGSVVMTFQNGRFQRWTRVGKRFAVEHWFPGSRHDATCGTRGIAERAQ